MKLNKQSKNILKNLCELVIIINHDLEITYADPESLSELLGYDHTHFIGTNFSQYVKNTEKITSSDLFTLNSRKIIPTLSLYHKEDYYVHLKAVFTSISEEDLNNEILILLSRVNRADLQEKLTCEDHLLEINDCFISENIYDLVCIINIDFKYVYINENAYFRTLGYKSGDLIGKSVEKILHPDDISKTRGAFKQGLKEGEGIIELRLKKKHGGYLWFEIKGKTFLNQNDEVLGLFISRNINERKQMEAKLKASEEKLKSMNKNLEKLVEQRTHELKESKEKFRLITENVSDIVSVFDESLELKYINQAQEKISGFSKEELIGESMIDYLHPEDVKKASRFFEEIKKTGTAYGEFRQIRKDGTYTWLQTSCKKIIDKEGKINYVFATKDINKKKKIEQKLKSSEEKYSNLFKFSNDGIIIHDIRGNIVDANKKVLKLFGYDKEQLLERRMYKLHPREEIIKIAKMWQEFKKEGYTRGEVKYKRKNGNIFHSEISNSLFKVGKKELVQVIIRDITKRKRTEEQLKASETKYRHLFENSPFIILLLNEQGKILDCNQACQDLVGIPKDSIKGKKFFELKKIIESEYIPILEKRFAKLKRGYKADPIDIRINNVDGENYWIKLSSTRVKIGRNQVIIQTFGHDITEQKKAELLIKEEIQKLKELDQMRKDLITRISHEVKTPLMSIEGSSELLLDAYKDSLGKEELELVKMNKRGTNKLSRLVENLLDVSRFEYKKLNLKKEASNLGTLIREATEEMAYLIQKRNINVIIESLDEIILNIDKLRIEQVITNLISNSLKNTPPRGEVRLKLERNTTWAKFTIEDSGIGLTKKELGQIFTKFGKIERSSRDSEDLDISGCGIGLYISKEIIKLHGGEILAESEGRNKGSKFIVKLPLNKEPDFN
ncbi:MAG: putative Signal transduction histidine kinase [Promethearchaeota archaeon]|nr:MAG: putative Signal transduction histidine kinase [Candidatus Lokiarchaeota archaeon]